MKTAIYHLESAAPYSQSRQHSLPKLEKEGADAYERRTWIHKAHFDENGQGFIPPMSFKQALDAAGKRLGKIPGRQNNTYTKHFLGGIIIDSPMPIPLALSDLEKERDELNDDEKWVHVQSTQFSWGGQQNADGKRGSGSRVFRRFPEVKSWSGDLKIIILDEVLTEQAMTAALKEAGLCIGLGRFRPENGGYYGRFGAELKSFS